MNSRTSLRTRLTVGFTASFLTFSLAACLSYFLWTRHAARSEAAERVLAAARLIAHEWTGDTTVQGIEQAIEYSRDDAHRHGWRDALDDIAIVVFDEEGHVLGASHYPHPSGPSANGGQWLTAAERGQAGTVVAGVDGHVLDARLRAQTLLLVTFALVVAAVAGVAAWIVVGRTLRPIGALADQADSAFADPLHAHLKQPSDDAEVRHLVATLNGFLDRLSENTRTREQFYAAAAHELRTPLAVLSASIEVTLSRPRDGDEYKETLTDLQDQTRRLTRLTEDLLTLNRLDVTTPNEITEEAEPVDIGDLCSRILSTLTPMIEARSLSVDVDIDRAAMVFAPPVHVAILVRNLLDNAVRYATPGGRISVSLLPSPRNNDAHLHVYNDYPAPDSLELDRLFEPFYRADLSRSSATGGNGLGLAICNRIARRHGWSLLIGRETDGICIDAEFPEQRHMRD